MGQTYLTLLSSRQKIWLAAGIAAACLLGAVGVLLEPAGQASSDERLAVTMSIREIAPRLDMTGKGLARELGLPLDAPKNKPLAALGIAQDQLDEATAHVRSHRPTRLKYYLFAGIVLWALVYMIRLGRPDQADLSRRRSWYPRTGYIACLILAVLVCGLALGKSPNPMESVVKVVKSLAGLYPSVLDKVLALLFFVALGIVGNKLICGWACPFGALQELIYSLPLLRRAKRWKIPFWLSNALRCGLFVVMLLLLFGVVGGTKGFVIYHYLNPFNLFDRHFEHWLILATTLVALALSFVVYRPFCHLVCPFGLVSWIAERFSLVRIKIDRTACTNCGACGRACPSQAAQDKVAGKLLGADCYSCARCLNACPQDAIRYGSVFS
ncbi:MAG: 4Fe-4S binding protein [Sedimentisphaerales bacterium]|nr:4Fe-4S binding protein [Sedimentisphaerales bacterium]